MARVTKLIYVSVSVGADDTRTMDELEADIRKGLEAANPKLVTVYNKHYLVDGRICLPHDFDPETQDFKVGRTPPPWAQTDAEKERIKREALLAGTGGSNPAHLRTVEETIAARKKSERKPAVPVSAPVRQEIEVDDDFDLDEVSEDVEDRASAVASDAAKKFRLGGKKK